MRDEAEVGSGVRDHPMVRSSIERSLAVRYEAYADEVQRLVDATYRVIERTGSIDPTVRDILEEAGLSTQAFYRHFRSKDELLAVLLDDGRRRLVSYLEHRMSKATTADRKVRAWIEGVMAQAGDAAASARTRPFIVQQDRLTDRFEADQRSSVNLLIDLLVGPLRELGQGRAAALDATAIYHCVHGAMSQHVRDRTQPTRAELDHLARFCLRAVSDPGES